MIRHILAARVAPAFGRLARLQRRRPRLGQLGHRIAAEIAEHYLEPLTARQVRDLLAIENATTLAQVSSGMSASIRYLWRKKPRWITAGVNPRQSAKTST